MAKDKKQREKEEKIKSLFQKTITTTTSVTAVVVATILMPRVEASFIDVSIFDDAIYYQLDVREILEEDEEAQAPELRLNVTNQWDDILIPLDYGVNEGLIEPLRPGQAYTFSVQMYANFLWSTIASQTVRTERVLNGKILHVDTLTQATDETLSLTVSTYHTLIDQDSEGQFSLRLSYEDDHGRVVREQPLEERRSLSTFTDLPPGIPLAFELIFEDIDERIQLDTLSHHSWPRFEGALAIKYDVHGRVQFDLDATPWDRETLVLELAFAEGDPLAFAWLERPDWIPIEGDTTVRLYAQSETFHPQRWLLSELTLSAYPTPTFFLSETRTATERIFTFTLAWDETLYGIPTLTLISGEDDREVFTFDFLQGEGQTVVFRYSEPIQNRTNVRMIVSVPILNQNVDRPLVDTTLQE